MSAVAASLPYALVTPPALTELARVGADVARVALERPPSLTLDAVRPQRLEALVRVCARASNTGWDGLHAEPVAQSTFFSAKEFLDALPLTCASPEMSAHPDGDVEFEWFKSNDHVLTVSIGSNVMHYAALAGNNPPVSGREVFAGTIPAPIADMLAELALSAR